jgi:nitroimidazol reductase NimA-like FMN-containing flavoprotein (pyridoxamine 5'-phosphate oxidase superfamily)
VIPAAYGYDPDTVYLHGSVASQSPNTAGLACITVTLTEGLVLARSVFEHTINYRSAMIYGQPRLVTDPAERLAGLRCITEHVAPGQWDYARQLGGKRRLSPAGEPQRSRLRVCYQGLSELADGRSHRMPAPFGMSRRPTEEDHGETDN